jgi:hypothetical protein
LTAKTEAAGAPAGEQASRHDSPRTLDDLIAALRTLNDQGPVDRARGAKILIEVCKNVLSGVRRQAIYEAVIGPPGMLRVDVAHELGVGKSAVTKAIDAHQAAQRVADKADSLPGPQG